MSQTLYPNAAGAEMGAIERPVERAAARGLSGTQKALLLIIGVKLIVFAFVFLAWLRLGLFEELYSDIVHYHEPDQYSFLTDFTTWDSSHYLILADHGYYQELHKSNAFAPLLPYMMRALTALTGSFIISGLLIANAASIAACYLFFVFTRKHWGESVAFRSLILLLAFPTSFFMSMIYTESIFLLLCVATFYFVSEGRLGLAAMSAFLLPLTRWIGILIIVPMGLALLLDRHYREGIPAFVGWWPRELLSDVRVHRTVLWATTPLLSGAVYLLLMWHLTGDALAHVHAAGTYASGWDVKNVVQPWKLITNLYVHGLSPHGYVNSFVDRVFFAGFLASIPLVYLKVSRPLFLFYLAMGMQPLLGSYMSYTRYVMPAFPLYIAWASYLQGRARLQWRLAGGMIALQIALLSLHTTNHWVA